MKQVDLLDSVALEWINSRAFLLAKSLNETTKLALRKILAEGLANGESIQKLTKRIKTYFDTDAKFRATRLARTEVIAASNEGTLQRYSEEGIDKSEWLASPDSCEDCAAEDGRIYPTAEAHNLIPKHPNCTCTWIASLD